MSDLVGTPNCWFSHAQAQICVLFHFSFHRSELNAECALSLDNLTRVSVQAKQTGLLYSKSFKSNEFMVIFENISLFLLMAMIIFYVFGVNYIQQSRKI